MLGQKFDLVLAIAGLVKRLTSGDTTFTLEVPVFQLRRGGFYGIVGRSGSGKSTLLDLLAMVMRPSIVERHTLNVPNGRGELVRLEMSQFVGVDGSVRSRGDLEGQSRGARTGDGPRQALNDAYVSAVRRNYLGYVLQSGGLIPYLTVRENLELPFRMSGLPFNRADIGHRAERFGLTLHLDKKPSGLSSGQRQRVSILRALVTNPVLLLADEPTASVDEQLAKVIVSEMRAMANQQRTTVVMVSHDIELVAAFADDMVRLSPESNGSGAIRSVCALRSSR